MKRRILATVTLAAVIGLSAAPAEAAVSAVGWWTRNPTASAPEGGLQVANGLDGRISYGAVRAVENADAIETATLTLQESGQSVNASGASLQACPAAGSWNPGKGALTDGPLADCKVATVPLTRNAAGQWTADVTSVLKGESAAVAIVPGSAPSVFQVSFNPPTLDVKLRAASAASPSSSSSSSNDFDASEFSSPSGSAASSGSSSGSTGSSASGGFESDSTFTPSSSGSFSSTSGGFGSPATFSPTVEPNAAPQEVAAATDAPAEGDASAPSGSSFRARPAAAPPLEVGGNRWAQFGLFLALAAVIGTIAGFGRNRLTAKSS